MRDALWIYALKWGVDSFRRLFHFSAIIKHMHQIHCLCSPRQTLVLNNHIRNWSIGGSNKVDKWVDVDWVLISAFYEHVFCRWNDKEIPVCWHFDQCDSLPLFRVLFVQSTDITQNNGSQRKCGRKSHSAKHFIDELLFLHTMNELIH